MTRYAALLIVLLIPAPSSVFAQTAVIQDRQFYQLERGARELDPNDARQVRAEFDELLRQHPPSLRTVFQADPTLMQRADYLAPYPRIAEFLKQHPEVARDPQYFVGAGSQFWSSRERTPAEQAYDMLEGVLAGLAFFVGVMAVLFVLATLVRQAIAHRRWSRQSKVQTEVHTKILDRLQSNDELLAYIQTPAGQRFLQSGPSPMADVAEPRTLAAPFGRIFWSVQVGVILLALGIGFWFVQRNVMAEIAPVFSSMGVIAVALGIGAICSGGLSYLLSVRFGLLKREE
jgi:hypothetical protein